MITNFILILMGVGMIATSKSFNFTSLDDETAIFENIGKIKMLTSEWKILTHVNIDEFSQEIGVQKYEQICTKIKLTNTSSHSCTTSSKLLHSKLIEIIRLNSYFMQALDEIPVRREKRQLFNAIGRISKTLFGTLSDEDGIFFDTQVGKINENEHKMATTIERQTTLLNNLFSLTTNSTNDVNSKLKIFQESLNSLEKTRNEIHEDGNFNKLNQGLNELFSIGTYAISQYQQRQEELYMALIQPESVLTPKIFDPSMLMKQLKNLQEHLPTYLAFPFKLSENNIFKIYHLSKVRLISRNHHIIFEITIPLSTRST
jgi:hypothetical protein